MYDFAMAHPVFLIIIVYLICKTVIRIVELVASDSAPVGFSLLDEVHHDNDDN